MKKILSIALALVMMLSCVSAFASCSKKDEVKIGVQSGTTGEFFLKGDAGWGFDGYSNISTETYDTGALAM